MTEQALVKKEQFVALGGDRERVRKVLEANLAGMTDASAFSLPRIRMPSRGAQSWELPTAQGEETLPQIDCIILAHQPCRGYWPGDFRGNEPPQCSSPDGVTGYGDPGGSCRSCHNCRHNDRYRVHRSTPTSVFTSISQTLYAHHHIENYVPLFNAVCIDCRASTPPVPSELC